MKKKDIFLPLFFIFLIIYEEIIFHIFVFNTFTLNFLYIILFSIPIGSAFYLLSNFFKSKLNRIPTYLFLSLTIFLFIANYIYYKVYISIISLYSLINGNQVLGFFGHILKIATDNWYVLLLMFIPLIFFIIMDVLKKVSYEKINIIPKLVIVIVIALIQASTLLSINLIKSDDIYSNKNLYSNIHSPLLTTEKFGLLTMFRLDCQRTIFGFTEKDIEVVLPPVVTPEENIPVDEEVVVTYNELDINWDALIENESNETIKSMHRYFSVQNATNKNDYTGMFEGKNLIVFVAEAFSPMAIDEVLTPNLYRLYNEGFQFDNFYTPLFPVSTADGEYITDTSLIPKEGVWSLYRIAGNYMPYSYANVFEDLGYSSRSYHNNTYTYYHRDKFLKTMGYDSYLACKNGLEKRINCKIWPQSDYEMVKTTIDDYINDEHFITYYMTVSGHLEYNNYGNTMAIRNWDKVKDLKLSTAAKAYLACNIELDKAIGELITRLEKAGKLDDTVIAISGDHYPYGLTLEQVNELSDYKKDENFELHRMSFLLWNNAMEGAIKVEKYASSLDILPTILNLFGIKYDSRLLIGTDILSNSIPLVIYSNRSFITDKCRYNSITKEIIPNGDTTCTDEEVKAFNSIIYNKFKYSKLILENDYYRKLYTSLNWSIKE
ncbi:MAG: sulfatase-like hydrolase/transferase [Bacilli bacterium]|nr:sulfatase-like hydrolase/transferase [Bacilli bacterium]